MQGRSPCLILALSAAAFGAAGAVPALGSGAPAAPPLTSQVKEDPKPGSTVQLTLRGGRGAEAGETLRYRFTVRNRGRVAVHSVRVTTRLPRTLKYLRGGEFRPAKRTVVFALGSIAAGRAKSRVLVVRVADSFDERGRIALHAKVSGRAAPSE